ncbi:3-isopropylmalate dehydrogenase [Clostridium tetanomorphum]|uniref:3-isopropylmalate dehydrogenase n=1 Tax=Clostridium tetanomorphum TaxID=1553 RepID=UPI000DD01A34|nr:3-isopropylmalate dehydrogenase [Clostridium tetanomorphum]
MKEFKIAVVPGDGIGVEITEQALKILNKISEKYNTKFNCIELKAGGCAIDAYGEALPKETIEKCKQCNALFLGAIGGPKWDTLPGERRPEKALLKLRSELGLYANLRPAKVFDELKSASPLKDSLVEKGIDLLVVRELIGGIYFGKRGTVIENGTEKAYDTEAYTLEEVKRIAHVAFRSAMNRRKKVTSIDKANVLDSSRLWRKVVTEVSKEYPEVKLNHMYVDNAAMQLVKEPSQFDVILTNNIFGDILSDEASMLTGSIGMLASWSVGQGAYGMYEPIHGSAPDIAGKNIANPLAQILSAAMMLDYSFNMTEAAKDIENAVKNVLNKGYRTPDIWTEGMIKVGTKEMGELVLQEI